MNQKNDYLKEIKELILAELSNIDRLVEKFFTTADHFKKEIEDFVKII